MNFKLASNILRATWAIDPATALSHGNLIARLLSGENLLPERAIEKAEFTVAQVGSSNASGDKSNKKSVAVIPIKGELMKYDEPCEPAGMITIGNWIKQADADPNIDAIMLDIDSPGGTVDGTETLGNIVKNTQKTITAFVNGMMLSGALWIGSNAKKIIASTPHDRIGSIGVMTSFMDMVPYWEKQGIKFHRINADQSKDKNKIFSDALSGDYASIKKEMLNPLADAFINKVRENRPEVKDSQLTGKMFFAKDVKGTLIDEIGDFEYALNETINLITNNNTKNLKAMSEQGQNIDERSLIEKIAATFGLKPVEKQKEEEITAKLTDYESKMNAMLQKMEELANENKQVKENFEAAQQELTALQTENERLKNLPGAPSATEKTETDGKADHDGHVYNPARSFEENYAAIGKAFGFLS